MKEATLYEKLPNKTVRCLACSNYCVIPNKNYGICGVRKNIDGKLFLLVYGKSISANIDPIEKKPLFHFLPGTGVFSIGTFGCNFSCEFCQNWDISQTPKNGNEKVIHNSYDLSPEQIVKIAQKNKIPSIAYTYNEPAVFFEYAYDTARLAHKKGIKNVYVTNGYESKEALEKILPFIDAMNIDLKSFNPEFYRKICGGNLKPVLDNIKNLFGKVWIELTTLIIPGHNDSDTELKKIAEFISKISKEIPWHISRFYPAYKMNNIIPTPYETLRKAYKIGKDAGLKYIYIGNIHDLEHSNTYCPKCGRILIKRENYSILENNIKNGKCKFCGEKIPGVWK